MYLSIPIFLVIMGALIFDHHLKRKRNQELEDSLFAAYQAINHILLSLNEYEEDQDAEHIENARIKSANEWQRLKKDIVGFDIQSEE